MKHKYLAIVAAIVAVLAVGAVATSSGDNQYAWFVYYNEFELDTLDHGYGYVPLLQLPVLCEILNVTEYGVDGRFKNVLFCYTITDWYFFYVFYFDVWPMIESTPDKSMNFTAYVQVPCSICDVGFALLDSAMQSAFNVMVTHEGYVHVRVTEFDPEASEVRHYPTWVSYIGDTVGRWFKIDVGVTIDYTTRNMNTSVYVRDVNGAVLFSYSGTVYDVYTDFRYPSVFIMTAGVVDNFGIYYPSLAIRGVAPVATVISTVPITETATLVETVTSSVPIVVERATTVTTTLAPAEGVDYTVVAVVAVMVLLLAVAVYLLLRRRR